MKHDVVIYRRGYQRPRRVGPATVNGPPTTPETLHLHAGKRKNRAPKIVIDGKVITPPLWLCVHNV